MASNSLKSIILEFRHSKSGNVAAISAVVLGLIALVLALVYEQGQSVSHHQKLTAGTDNALLAGLTLGKTQLAKGDSEWQAKAEAHARAMFENFAKDNNYQNVVLTVNYTSSGSQISGKADFNYDMPLTLGQLYGKESINLVNSIQAESSFDRPIDVIFVIDVSMSMGIGATYNDQYLMYNSIKNSRGTGCGLSCHAPKNSYERPFIPSAYRDIGATLRIDVVRSGLLTALSDFESSFDPQNIRISVYTYHNYLNEYSAPTNDFSKLKSDAQLLDIISYDDNGPNEFGGTYMRKNFSDLADILKTRSQSDAQAGTPYDTIVVIIGDGYENAGWNQPWGYFPDGMRKYGRDTSLGQTLPGFVIEPNAFEQDNSVVQPFNPNSCNVFKDIGADVYTGQIMYNIAPNTIDEWWDADKSKYLIDKKSEVDLAFAACSTIPAQHYEAEKAEEIEPLFKNITRSIISKSVTRLTQ